MATYTFNNLVVHTNPSFYLSGTVTIGASSGSYNLNLTTTGWYGYYYALGIFNASAPASNGMKISPSAFVKKVFGGNYDSGGVGGMDSATRYYDYSGTFSCSTNNSYYLGFYCQVDINNKDILSGSDYNCQPYDDVNFGDAKYELTNVSAHETLKSNLGLATGYYYTGIGFKISDGATAYNQGSLTLTATRTSANAISATASYTNRGAAQYWGESSASACDGTTDSNYHKILFVANDGSNKTARSDAFSGKNKTTDKSVNFSNLAETTITVYAKVMENLSSASDITALTSNTVTIPAPGSGQLKITNYSRSGTTITCRVKYTVSGNATFGSTNTASGVKDGKIVVSVASGNPSPQTVPTTNGQSGVITFNVASKYQDYKITAYCYQNFNDGGGRSKATASVTIPGDTRATGINAAITGTTATITPTFKFNNTDTVEWSARLGSVIVTGTSSTTHNGTAQFELLANKTAYDVIIRGLDDGGAEGGGSSDVTAAGSESNANNITYRVLTYGVDLKQRVVERNEYSAEVFQTEGAHGEANHLLSPCGEYNYAGYCVPRNGSQISQERVGTVGFYSGSANVSGLTPDTGYRLYVYLSDTGGSRCVDFNGEYDAVNYIDFTTAKVAEAGNFSGKVTGKTVTVIPLFSRFNASQTVTWTASIRQGSVTGGIIATRTATASQTSWPEVVFTGLNNGTKYFITFTAFDDNNNPVEIKPIEVVTYGIIINDSTALKKSRSLNDIEILYTDGERFSNVPQDASRASNVKYFIVEESNANIAIPETIVNCRRANPNKFSTQFGKLKPNTRYKMYAFIDGVAYNGANDTVIEYSFATAMPISQLGATLYASGTTIRAAMSWYDSSSPGNEPLITVALYQEYSLIEIKEMTKQGDIWFENLVNGKDYTVVYVGEDNEGNTISDYITYRGREFGELEISTYGLTFSDVSVDGRIVAWKCTSNKTIATNTIQVKIVEVINSVEKALLDWEGLMSSGSYTNYTDFHYNTTVYISCRISGVVNRQGDYDCISVFTTVTDKFKLDMGMYATISGTVIRLTPVFSFRYGNKDRASEITWNSTLGLSTRALVSTPSSSQTTTFQNLTNATRYNIMINNITGKAKNTGTSNGTEIDIPSSAIDMLYSTINYQCLTYGVSIKQVEIERNYFYGAITQTIGAHGISGQALTECGKNTYRGYCRIKQGTTIGTTNVGTVTINGDDVRVTNLSPNTNYRLYIYLDDCKDQNGLYDAIGYIDFTTLMIGTAGVFDARVTGKTVTLTPKFTRFNASKTIYWSAKVRKNGPTGTVVKSSSNMEATQTMLPSTTITGLETGTKYYITYTATDDASNVIEIPTIEIVTYGLKYTPGVEHTRTINDNIIEYIDGERSSSIPQDSSRASAVKYAVVDTNNNTIVDPVTINCRRTNPNTFTTVERALVPNKTYKLVMYIDGILYNGENDTLIEYRFITKSPISNLNISTQATGTTIGVTPTWNDSTSPDNEPLCVIALYNDTSLVEVKETSFSGSTVWFSDLINGVTYSILYVAEDNEGNTSDNYITYAAGSNGFGTETTYKLTFSNVSTSTRSVKWTCTCNRSIPAEYIEYDIEEDEESRLEWSGLMSSGASASYINLHHFTPCNIICRIKNMKDRNGDYDTVINGAVITKRLTVKFDTCISHVHRLDTKWQALADGNAYNIDNISSIPIEFGGVQEDHEVSIRQLVEGKGSFGNNYGEYYPTRVRYFDGLTGGRYYVITIWVTDGINDATASITLMAALPLVRIYSEEEERWMKALPMIYHNGKWYQAPPSIWTSQVTGEPHWACMNPEDETASYDVTTFVDTDGKVFVDENDDMFIDIEGGN